MSSVYKIDVSRISYREDSYRDFWQREPDLILHQTDDATPHIDTYRFPRQESSRVGDCVIYLTGGMSDMIQPKTENYDEVFQRTEVSAYAPRIIMNNSGSTDFIGWIVGWMAHYPFLQNTYFMQGQTFDWGKPITPESDMHGFYFAHLPFVDEKELCDLSGTAKSILHLVTLSKKELEYKLEHGATKLLKILEGHRVPPFFDLHRQCIFKGEKGAGGNVA